MDIVRGYIHQHLEEELSLEQLSEVAVFSRYHFHRIFKGMVGESVKAYVRRVRLDHAAILLKQTSDSVVQIALASGFESHSAFSRAFAKQFGMPPSVYRIHAYARLEVQQMTYWNDIELRVEIVERVPMDVAYIRHEGAYCECSRAWDTLCMWAAPRGYLQPGVELLGICYNDPDVTSSEKILYDACIELRCAVQELEQVRIQRINGGKFARVTHEGAYDTLSETYSQVCGQWLPQHGYHIASRPSIEVYLNSPEDTEQQDLLTDIYIPLSDT